MKRKGLSIATLVAGAGALVAAASSCSSQPPIGPGADAASESQGTSSSSGSSSGAGSSGASSGAGSSGASSSSSGGMALTWYFTCGDPVCQAPYPPVDGGILTDDAGAPCPDIGTPCSVAGERCGTRNPQLNCGATEVCDAHDPTRNPGGCPISSRKFKDGIRYVDSSGLEQLHDETLALRLATYRYKPEAADPNPQHLGFIIEDTPLASPAVDRSREHVDLYGYMSMLVATMQVQEEEIAELRRELAAAKGGACR